MKKGNLIGLCIMGLIGFSACESPARDLPESFQPSTPAIPNPEEPQTEDLMHLKITIGAATFTANLENNAATQAFLELVPMTVHMTEYNRNEKYWVLPVNLPVCISRPGRIECGDLMLFGPRTLVLFYINFSTAYEYTRLGKIEDTEGLAEALGPGNVTVQLEVVPNEKITEKEE